MGVASMQRINIVLFASACCTDALLLRPSRFAYVQVCQDDSENDDSLLQAVESSYSLRNSTNLPIILLTNKQTFADGSSVSEAFKKIDVQVQLLKQDQFPQRLLDTVPKERWRAALQKLQVWNMSQFDKVLLLDIDSVTTKNLDWVFDLDGVWCQTELSSVGCVFTRGLNSGMLLLPPSQDKYTALMNSALRQVDLFLGDQQILGDQEIVQVFLEEQGIEFQRFDPKVGTWGQCILPDADVPSFIHKSDFSNSCFGLDHAETCKNQTLGRLWHRNFCGARKLMNLQHPSAIELCSADGWDEP